MGIPEIDDDSTGGAAVKLGELLLGAGEADLTLAQPALPLGFGEAGEDVVADLDGPGVRLGLPVLGQCPVDVGEVADVPAGRDRAITPGRLPSATTGGLTRPAPPPYSVGRDPVPESPTWFGFLLATGPP
ncbi:hypothetical protein ACIA8E_39705 [Streptomyces sp. NPDC051664]|uniref:hypothetical protein n=1 Tax=Streptomyces sp. NPDC051664 TaxID=3365668 RepID=UPI0037979A33